MTTEQDSDPASRGRVDSSFNEVHKGKELEKAQEEVVTSESTGHPSELPLRMDSVFFSRDTDARTPQQSINGNGANLPEAIPEDTDFHGFLTMTRTSYPSGGPLPPPDPSDGTTSEGKSRVAADSDKESILSLGNPEGTADAGVTIMKSVVTDDGECSDCKCDKQGQNYYAAIRVTDEHGKDTIVQKLLLARDCFPGESCKMPVSLKPTEFVDNPEAKLSVCGDHRKPGHNTGRFHTQGRVYIGVDEDTSKLKTFVELPTNSRYLLEVTVQRCIEDCNPLTTTTIFWADSNNKNYYMIPNPENDSELIVKHDSDSKDKMATYRVWSTTYHHTG